MRYPPGTVRLLAIYCIPDLSFLSLHNITLRKRVVRDLVRDSPLRPPTLLGLVGESHADKGIFPPHDLRLARYFVEIYFEDIGYMNMGWKKQTRTC